MAKPTKEEMIALVQAKRARENKPSREDMIRMVEEKRAREVSDEPKHSAARSALDHYANTVSYGYLPQLTAGTEMLVNKASKTLAAGLMLPVDHPDMVNKKLEHQGFIIEEQEPSYVKSRDEVSKRLKEEFEENPVSSGAGMIGGAVSMFGPSRAFINAGKSPLGKVGRTAAVSGAMGFARNPGDVEGEINPVQLGDRAKEGAIAAALGAALGTAIEKPWRGTGGGKGGLGKILEKKANEKAVSAAIAPNKKGMEELKRTGQIDEIGRMLLEEKIVRPLSTTKGIADKVGRLKEEAGENVGDLIRGNSSTTIDAKQLADKIARDPDMARMAKIPGMESAAKQTEQRLETLASYGSNVPLPEAQALRQGLDRSINMNKPIPEMKPGMEALYKMRTYVRDAMNDAINKVAQGGSKDALLKANKRYSNLAKIEEFIEKKLAGEASNRTVSLSDSVMAAGGMASGGIGNAAMLGVANKAIRTFGDQTSANLYNTAAKIIQASPDLSKIAAKNPTAMNQLIHDIVSRIQKSGGVPAFAENQREERSPASEKPMPYENAQSEFLKGN